MTRDRAYYDEDDRPRRDRPRPGGPGAAGWLFSAALGVALAAGVFLARDYVRLRNAPPPTDPSAQLRQATERPPLDSEEREAVELFKKLKPSVVNVDVVQRQRVGWQDQVAERQTGAGSGFVWDDDGRIVTNYHVVAELARIPNTVVRVTLADRTAWDAVVVGASPEYDLAVLQFAAHDRPAAGRVRKIELGTSGDLEVGQKVYAIGNPLGLSLTMTKGIISALDRPIKSPANTTIPGAVQTDAAINPGNSGGPLLDKAGRLIGVNTAIATTSGSSGNIGIGFAIPSDLVNAVVTQIVQHGRVLQPDLGIELVEQQKVRRARFDHGVMVERVTPNGPAAKAGLRGLAVTARRVEQFGDLITGVNGEDIDGVEDYERVVRSLKPGEPVRVKFRRIDLPENGRGVPRETEKEATLTVGSS
ncbi:2-alkenal reductase : HtrA2 peptidase OS=Nitrosococcus watsoni (strain C-113) GN=Nwat_1685 PE=4 SV=1: Trypsin_2: PDZ_2 [Gemmataceae bacterium]|nr:2-alkenal reductase : HtrA2 peptidase OS=Nitrosococcus watsoni (strain C-113) GN=Nwat_1685 PE=4 SV=1: Trypsin_2: PDZ_2 [Gemmataceae bacterium]VTT99917.1 2-alkenal reductase : HtrA2 peptidase OS=Nitrosococcus watsoni (strain C-113) GN=Nwat_1685 PE=4 SV=1: Trypsin_2: PDZ_2 [Gemmataceae bacterium]